MSLPGEYLDRLLGIANCSFECPSLCDSPGNDAITCCPST